MYTYFKSLLVKKDLKTDRQNIYFRCIYKLICHKIKQKTKYSLTD